jgi:hypothetical protein
VPPRTPPGRGWRPRPPDRAQSGSPAPWHAHFGGDLLLRKMPCRADLSEPICALDRVGRRGGLGRSEDLAGQAGAGLPGQAQAATPGANDDRSVRPRPTTVETFDRRIMRPPLVAVSKRCFTCCNATSGGAGRRRLAAYLPRSCVGSARRSPFVARREGDRFLRQGLDHGTEVDCALSEDDALAGRLGWRRSLRRSIFTAVSRTLLLWGCDRRGIRRR